MTHRVYFKDSRGAIVELTPWRRMRAQWRRRDLPPVVVLGWLAALASVLVYVAVYLKGGM